MALARSIRRSGRLTVLSATVLASPRTSRYASSRPRGREADTGCSAAVDSSRGPALSSGWWLLLAPRNVVTLQPAAGHNAAAWEPEVADA